MLVERGKSLALRETVPATVFALHPLRMLLKIWMNGPGGLVARESRDEIFAGVTATDGSRSVRLFRARRSSVNVWLQSRSLPARGRVGLEVHRCLRRNKDVYVFISTGWCQSTAP